MSNVARMALFRVRVRTRVAYVGVSTSALARELGLTPACMHVRLHAVDLRVGQIEELARVLGVPVEYLTDSDPSAWAALFAPAPMWSRNRPLTVRTRRLAAA